MRSSGKIRVVGQEISYSLRVGFGLGNSLSGSGRPVFAVRVSGRVRVCWIFCRVGLTVYIRPDVHL